MRILLLLLLVAYVVATPLDSIHMSQISSLTFYKNMLTTARRTQPVPQLVCIGGNAQSTGYIPYSVTCINKGYNGLIYEWHCTSMMDEFYSLGGVHVSCEGYNAAGDLNVLVGSCSLNYELNYNGTSVEGNSTAIILVLVIVGIGIVGLCVVLISFGGTTVTHRTPYLPVYGYHHTPYLPTYHHYHHNRHESSRPHNKHVSSSVGGSSTR
jgi:hypothetical protein